MLSHQHCDEFLQHFILRGHAGLSRNSLRFILAPLLRQKPGEHSPTDQGLFRAKHDQMRFGVRQREAQLPLGAREVVGFSKRRSEIEV
jgi:hypothetical protein